MLDTNTSDATAPTDVAALLAAELPTTNRRYFGRRKLEPNPIEVPVVVDGEDAVEVGLSGRHGVGKAMRLDPSVWAEIGASLGKAWSLCPNGAGGFYVGRRGRASGEGDRSGGPGLIYLSRIVAGARKGQVVLFQNGDTRDLRRSNLLVLSRAEAARFRAERAAARASVDA